MSPKDSLRSVPTTDINVDIMWLNFDNQICRRCTHAMWVCGPHAACACIQVQSFKPWQSRYLLISLMLCVHVWQKRSKSSRPYKRWPVLTANEAWNCIHAWMDVAVHGSGITWGQQGRHRGPPDRHPPDPVPCMLLSSGSCAHLLHRLPQHPTQLQILSITCQQTAAVHCVQVNVRQ